MAFGFKSVKREIEFWGYCPYCGLPMDFTEEKTREVSECPLCFSPISFSEYLDFDKDALGYEIVPDPSGESFERDGFIVNDGVLLEYRGDSTDITIPNGVIAIGSDAFRGNKRIRRVSIHGGVKHIFAEAFLGCDGLREIKLSEGLLTIGNSAFRECRRIDRISVPESLVAAGYAIFHSCDNLTELLMPMNIRYLGGSPYGFCKKLKVANIPHCVKDSGAAWFQYNDAIEILTVGRGATRLDCRLPALREVYFENKEGWCVESSMLFSSPEPIDGALLAQPKSAASYVRKLGAVGKHIFRPAASPTAYWYKL